MIFLDLDEIIREFKIIINSKESDEKLNNLLRSPRFIKFTKVVFDLTKEIEIENIDEIEQLLKSIEYVKIILNYSSFFLDKLETKNQTVFSLPVSLYQFLISFSRCTISMLLIF